MEYQLRYGRDENTIIFTQNAFDKAIGKRVPVTANGKDVGLCIIVAAEVIEQGRAVILTVESDVQLAAEKIEGLSYGIDGAPTEGERPT